VTNGDSLGKKLIATSNALECQNSLSFLRIIGSICGSCGSYCCCSESLEMFFNWNKKRSSVEIQKYETA